MSSSLVFFAQGRKRRLFRPRPAAPFHVRFQVRGRDRLFSTRLSELDDLPLAKAKAKAEIDRLYALPNDTSGRPRKLASLGQIVDAYDPAPRDVAPDTAQQNRAAFLRVLRVALGLTTNEQVRSESSKCLEDETVPKEYQRRMLRATQALDLERQESAAVSINTTLRKARSLFKPAQMDCYRELALPDLTGFRKVPPLKVDADMSFVPFPAGTIERIEALMLQMPRNIYLATLLMRRLGLRNREVQFAKWEWFRTFGNGTGEITIERKPYFKIKNNSVRVIGLPSDLMKQLKPHWGQPDDWVIDLPTATQRYEATHDEINRWLRPILADRQKCSYELRKHAGSEVLSLPESQGGGLAAAARFLGDSIQITEKHYARYLRPVSALSGEQARAQFRVMAA